jgi:Conserved oligomeric complex COG6
MQTQAKRTFWLYSCLFHVQVDGLEEGCKSISTRLVTADADMRQFTERAQLLRRQRGDLSKRADQVTEFLHRFQLSEVYMYLK